MFKQIRLPGGGERYPKTWGKTRNNDGKTIEIGEMTIDVGSRFIESRGSNKIGFK
jgi:hypothetical protein